MRLLSYLNNKETLLKFYESNVKTNVNKGYKKGIPEGMLKATRCHLP
jgi:hypothetical protein